LEVDSSCPSWGVPLTVGGVTSTGGRRASGAADTTAVGDDVADLDPAVVVAVTTDRMVWPTSALVRVYLLRAAPLIVEQLRPAELQAFQR
jgi:hypothetical protein